MSINKMITKRKTFDLLLSQQILQGNVWRSVWRICMWILGLKGLMCTAVCYPVQTKVNTLFSGLGIRLNKRYNTQTAVINMAMRRVVVKQTKNI